MTYPDAAHRLLDGRYRSASPLRTIASLLTGQSRRMAAASVCFVVKQSPQWVLPLATQHILDAAMGPAGAMWTSIGVWAVISGLLLAQNIPMHALYTKLVSATVRDAQRDLRIALVIKLQELSIAFHDDAQAGKLQSKVLRDVETIGQVLRSATDIGLMAGTLAIVALTVALREAPVMAIFYLLAVPVAAGLVWRFESALDRRNQAFRRDLEAVSSRVSEMIEMLPVTRAHAAEAGESQRMEEQLERITDSGRRLDVVTELFGACTWVTFNGFQLVCLVFCVWLLHRGMLTFGQLVMFQGYFGMLVGLVSATLGVLPQLSAGVESIRSVGEVLESEEVENNQGKKNVGLVRGELRFEGVSFRYPAAGRPALEDVTLRIAAGECVALLGESGSGKSTLVNLVLGFRRPTAGRILLDGLDMAEIDFRTFRRQLAVVPQQTVLFAGTVRENLLYGLNSAEEQKMMEVLERTQCAEFVRRLPQGLETPLGQHGGRLSGGQRQRLAIARALLRDPRVIILDEATSALDAESEHLLQQAIGTLVANRTTLIVAHRLSSIRHAQRVVVLGRGCMVEQGSPAELRHRTGSAFSRLYDLQAGAVSIET